MRVLSVRHGFHDARHVLIRHRTCMSQLVVGGYAGGRIISIVSFAEVTAFRSGVIGMRVSSGIMFPAHISLGMRVSAHTSLGMRVSHQ